MRIYVRKLNSQQCTNKSISVTMSIFQDFFENKDAISIIGKKSNKKGYAPFTFTREREDPRFGGDFKDILRTEGGGSFKIGDILLVEKKAPHYVVSLITENDPEFSTFDSLLMNGFHTEIFTEEYEDSDKDDVFKHKLYGIHIKGINDALSEDNPHISIGWSKMGDLSDCKTKEEIELRHTNIYPDSKSRARGQDVGQIYRFVVEAQIGDYVVFGDGSVAHIGRIESDYYYSEDNENQDKDYVNNRKMQWLKSIPYCDLSLQFKRSLSSAMSFFRLNDYKSVVSELLNNTYQKDDECFENDDNSELNYLTGYDCKYSRNRIVFGAPGTGKSHTINVEKNDLIGENNNFDYERVTFHPDYSYANFVGTYKPVNDKNSEIKYEYVPGPFMRIYVKAIKNAQDLSAPSKPFLLIIEEINRANVAAVFGDIFQLLDRDENNISEYPVQTTEDMRKYLSEKLGGTPDRYESIKIPDNMFIWATMNSADQGVFPMDTAFKRRWDFTYIGINDNDDDLSGKTVSLGKKETQIVEWNELRKAINNYLSNQKINEDKLLGPYFLSRKIVIPEDGNTIDSEKFIAAFKSKVIMYLFEDAAKQRRSIFDGCPADKRTRYSDICNEFEERGINIFHSDIRNSVLVSTLPDDTDDASGSDTE